MLCEIANPAASSLAELIRNPEDKRCTEVARLFWAFAKLFWANNEAMLVLITVLTFFSCEIRGTKVVYSPHITVTDDSTQVFSYIEFNCISH
jgi:hypothetical protein